MSDSRLSDRAKGIIDAKSGLIFSVVSLWEISIKLNIGKLQLNCSFEDLLTRLAYLETEILPISIEDLKSYEKLPIVPDHRDPFDRMLAIQSMNRALAFVSRDSAFNAYSVHRVWE